MREEYIKTSVIPKIVAKLHAEGITKQNYNTNVAIAILNETVAALKLIAILKEHESEILHKL